MLVAVFLWSGCILAISFMESWLKFRAPGVTLPIGLSIGKMMFNALNKIEWLFAATFVITYPLNKQQGNILVIILYSIVVWMLIVQTFWLLPAIDNWAGARINGENLAGSSFALVLYYCRVHQTWFINNFGL
ncbi:hypothetical protein BH10BAC3_BH10BAC3_09030 [soil metagenome]